MGDPERQENPLALKTLLLLRHAHALGGSSHLADHDRPLSERGQREADAVAARLHALGIRPDRILASPAERARATALAVAHEDAPIVEMWSLYGAGLGMLLEILCDLPDAVACALVVAHNPGLEELLQQLTGNWQGMAPATLARISLPVARWRDLGETTAGRLEEAWRAGAGTSLA
jgi:phosphohistidine phosphatase